MSLLKLLRLLLLFPLLFSSHNFKIAVDRRVTRNAAFFANAVLSMPLSSQHNVFEQDRQCTYDVTLRRLRAIIVVVEKQYYVW